MASIQWEKLAFTYLIGRAMIAPEKRIVVMDDPYNRPEDGPHMEFRLTYEGPRYSTQHDPVRGEPDKRREHKHDLRLVPVHKRLFFSGIRAAGGFVWVSCGGIFAAGWQQRLDDSVSVQRRACRAERMAAVRGRASGGYGGLRRVNSTRL